MTRSQTQTPTRATGAESSPAVGGVEPAHGYITDDDLHFFNEGTHYSLYEKLGAHPLTHEGREGTRFAVWAPNAEQVTLIGDFNGWDKSSHPLAPRGGSGIWEGFVPGVKQGTQYKYHIHSRVDNYRVDKPDPYGFLYESAQRGASVVWDLDYEWSDANWMAARGQKGKLDAPMSVYEVHLPSWRRMPEDLNRSLSYRELADELTEYVVNMGYTHVEFLPVMEHPYYGSWGYQTTGYFAPTSRFGPPQDFMVLVDRLHQAGVGVILDWAPSHFATDEHGLGFFDGTYLYEHSDPRLGRHPDWDSYIFNYSRHEVRAFLISSAMFWLRKYHIDGLRVDAVASMLYLDYSRKEGEWIPNKFGGRENLDAIDFLRKLNEQAYTEHADIQTIAEESTSWPMVSRPTYLGGLGFGYKWDMGWMNDTLDYMSLDPVYRQYHHNKLTFRHMYAFSENFALPLSHDEVVHGKRSMLEKMPGDDWQKFANLRLLYGYMFSQPGKKLMFMGDEFGQRREWNHDTSLDWHLLEGQWHEQLRTWVSHLNHLYRSEPAMHQKDCDPSGFDWIDCNDAQNCILAYQRRGESEQDLLIFGFNFTPVPRHNYRIGVPEDGTWREILNSDAKEYGGSGQGNMGTLEATPVSSHFQPTSINITLPPLGMVVFKHQPDESA